MVTERTDNSSGPDLDTDPGLDPETGRRPTVAIVAVLALCGTAVALQQTMVVPLLPEFPTILGVSADDASWLVTATLLTSAVATPVMSRLADMVGKRLMMLVCMVAMTAGSVLAALSSAFPLVIAGRALQGFAAALIPIGISIMRDELPRERVSSAVALMSATLGIGGALGLPLAGIVSESLGWHANFWLSAIVGVILLGAILLVIPESRVRTGGSFDYLGAVLLSIALTGLLLVISKGSAWGWRSEPVIVLFLIAVGALSAWVPFELRVGQPLVDLRTSARRPVLLTNIASVLLGFAMFANLLLTTQELQIPTVTGYGFGLPIITAGLLMVPSGLAMVIFAPVSGGMINRFGGRITLLTGGLVMALAYIARVFLSGNLTAVVIGSTLVSIGTAIAYAAMPTLIMASVPITETASANGLNTLLRAIGTSTSSATVAAILGTVTITVGTLTAPSAQAFQDVFWIAATAALLGCVVAWFIPRPSAAAASGPAGEPTPMRVGPAVSAGDSKDVVLRGRIRRPDGAVPYPAVVTVVTTDGDPVDWGRADHDGRYSIALPGPGRYLVLANAQGWSPKAQVMTFRHRAEMTGLSEITLTDQLTLSGQVTCGAAPVPHALVSLSEAAGASVCSLTADEHGHWCLPLPPPGRYVVAVLARDSGAAGARKVVLDARSAVVDVSIPAAG
ncbi:MFS transporter [Nakamurella multipartita]|uniref:Major facilitator superfamily MFS_1 n=1 Tax=Nakamurella multipartita (strain ATCC 700099 / DSM 44233 / CIP 104796 / JCM 9543 / NBRC 105858 / Y-104) TaxID=479431 RepID=C8XDC5_NAKMY|nr:MFS transporter [Nakamurella multipartita]ACV81615.1 major facilitator superfamily MFS_1 [Nakamurella multipartita DSM 44233]